MAIIYPSIEVISQLRVPPTEGERILLLALKDGLDDSYKVFYEPFLSGVRPDIIILKEGAGAVIVEVKDWRLSSYILNEHNHWFVKEKRVRILSPMQQAFNYKKLLFDLHLPLIAEEQSRAPQKNFFGVISCFVYFHNSNKRDLDAFYSTNVFPHKERNKRRDRYLSFGADQLGFLLKKITEKLNPNPIFTLDIYEEFVQRLMPPSFILKQNIEFDFDPKQAKVVESKPGFAKVKGVAGCGKTTIMAARAINAFLRLTRGIDDNPLNRYESSGKVLILTFNITLRNLIRDKLNEAKQGAAKSFQIINYHSFYRAKASSLGLVVSGPLCLEQYQIDIFQNRKISDDELYDAIFIDEIQDFESEWIKIVRDNFLTKNKEIQEMVLFGDHSQNIYQRKEVNKLNSVIVRGFGRWIELKRSYRFSADSPLIPLFQEFQKRYLLDAYEENILINSEETTQATLNINQDIIQYQDFSGENQNVMKVWTFIREAMRENRYHYNDVVIIASRIDILRELHSIIEPFEKTMIMFETEAENRALLYSYLDEDYQDNLSTADLYKKIKKLGEGVQEGFRQKLIQMRRHKKTYFEQNSGRLKMSTIHSYKGFESKVVFNIILPNDKPEIVYTGITRAKEDLYVLAYGTSEYADVFSAYAN